MRLRNILLCTALAALALASLDYDTTDLQQNVEVAALDDAPNPFVALDVSDVAVAAVAPAQHVVKVATQPASVEVLPQEGTQRVPLPLGASTRVMVAPLECDEPAHTANCRSCHADQTLRRSDEDQDQPTPRLTSTVQPTLFAYARFHREQGSRFTGAPSRLL